MSFPAVLYCGAKAGGKNAVDLRFSTKADPVTVSVSGKVTDKSTGLPIANALVRGHIVLWKHQGPELFEKAPYAETKTDERGSYSLQFVTALTVSGPRKGQDGLCVYVGAPGYETLPQYARQRVTTENTQCENFDFALDKGQRIAGVVVDQDARPVQDAVVRLQGGENGDWDFFGSTGQTKTDKEGKFELWISKGQGRWLNVTKQGYGTALFWDYLEKNDMGTLTLARGGSIQGRIVGPDGKGLANCEVSIREYPCGLAIDKVLTDSEGNYVLHGVPGAPSIIDFYKRKNGRYIDQWGQCNVQARLDPQMPLANAPTYKILAKDGQTVTGPDLTIGANTTVSGRLAAEHRTYALGGLLVRLDTSWGNMVEADADGKFHFPFVSPGKHSLTAYLPHNLRGDHGIGRTEVEVEPGKSLGDVQITLADLAELRVQYLDANGNPLAGVTAGATWSPSGDGGWTEGTRSDKEGWAVLYLYPEGVQYVRGFDHSGTLVAEAAKQVRPKAGEVLNNLRITMLPCAQLRGRLLDDRGKPLAGGTALCVLAFADGVRIQRGIRTDSEGRFLLERLTPGFVALSVEVDSVLFKDVTKGPFELKPGQDRDAGVLTLKDGLNKRQIAQDRNSRGMEHAQEVRAAAQSLFEKIKTADYEHYLKPAVHWSEFPIVGYYQTDHWFDVLVQWMCTTFKDNPIVNVQLGRVFLNPAEINGKKDLPTVPYELTLKNGRKLKGNLPFEYTFDDGEPHWHGLHGIDWHLSEANGK
jgi:hypothetical protein